MKLLYVCLSSSTWLGYYTPRFCEVYINCNGKIVLIYLYDNKLADFLILIFLEIVSWNKIQFVISRNWVSNANCNIKLSSSRLYDKDTTRLRIFCCIGYIRWNKRKTSALISKMLLVFAYNEQILYSFVFCIIWVALFIALTTRHPQL